MCIRDSGRGDASRRVPDALSVHAGESDDSGGKRGGRGIDDPRRESGGGAAGPVSYTHLDVYKRQELQLEAVI